MKRDYRVIVIGAGFGGMQAAISLAKASRKTRAEVILIDRNNFHTFVPLLYQVATAQIEAEKIAYPIRTLFRKYNNVKFIQAEATHIDFAARQVKITGEIAGEITEETTRSRLQYDFLVLATGSQTQFHQVAGAEAYSWPMRTLPEAITLRNQLIGCFEKAVQTQNIGRNLERQHPLLTFVIVGGGATGVEMAGALVELVKGPIKRDYPMIDMAQVNIVLIQSASTLLPNLPQRLGLYTVKKLKKLGVDVRLNTKVSSVDSTGVQIEGVQIETENRTEFMATNTVIWVAGVAPQPPKTSVEVAVASRGKLAVKRTLQLQAHSNVYAIGDVAYIDSANNPLAGVAPEALQQGVWVAKNIYRQSQSKPPRAFNYFNKGRLAIIGCFSGVGKIGPFTLSGFLAWVMWLAVHLVYLPGFRSRLLVLISWFHTYMFRDRAIRQIIHISDSNLNASAVHATEDRESR